MAGTGRTSMSIAGLGTPIPYPRNAPTSDALEPYLSEFLSDVSEVLHAALPEGALQDHVAEGRCPVEATRCYQRTRKNGQDYVRIAMSGSSTEQLARG